MDKSAGEGEDNGELGIVDVKVATTGQGLARTAEGLDDGFDNDRKEEAKESLGAEGRRRVEFCIHLDAGSVKRTTIAKKLRLFTPKTTAMKVAHPDMHFFFCTSCYARMQHTRMHT